MCRWRLRACLAQQHGHRWHLGALGRRAQQVEQREHGVCLATAEGRLELDDRFAALPTQPRQRIEQQPPHPARQVGAAEELNGVAVLSGGLAGEDLGQVGGELSLLVAPGLYIRVRHDHLAPGR